MRFVCGRASHSLHWRQGAGDGPAGKRRSKHLVRTLHLSRRSATRTRWDSKAVVAAVRASRGRRREPQHLGDDGGWWRATSWRSARAGRGSRWRAVRTTLPSCTLAAPTASEVCSGWRPCTRRCHCAQWPTSMSKRRTRGRTSGQFFLILRRHAGHFDRTAAVRTGRRDRRPVGLVQPAPGVGGGPAGHRLRRLVGRDARRALAAGPWRRGRPGRRPARRAAANCCFRRSISRCRRFFSRCKPSFSRFRRSFCRRKSLPSRSRRANSERSRAMSSRRRRVASSPVSSVERPRSLTTQDLCHIPEKSTIHKTGSRAITR